MFAFDRTEEFDVQPVHPVSLKFWGVRGSIPTPGPSTVLYGGNTPCVELRADGEVIILDSGTGIRGLGQSLLAEFKDQPLNLTLLLTHTHWDHIQGFPFFLPAYEARHKIRILGYEGAKEGLARIFSSQMEDSVFPVGFHEMPGHIQVQELRNLDFSIGKVRVRAAIANHPGICVGYRVYTSQGSIVYMPDNEPALPSHIAVKGSKETDTKAMARSRDERMTEFFEGADILILDSQYDQQEYQSHKHWGHACVDDAVSLALKAKVKKLFLFHHDPDHSDGKITALVEHARQLVKREGASLAVEAAREGVSVNLGDCS